MFVFRTDCVDADTQFPDFCGSWDCAHDICAVVVLYGLSNCRINSCFGWLKIYHLTVLIGTPVILSRSLTIAPQEKITGVLNVLCEIDKFLHHPALRATHAYKTLKH